MRAGAESGRQIEEVFFRALALPMPGETSLLQRVPALHPPPTLRAVADLDVETPHEGLNRRQLFLILRPTLPGTGVSDVGVLLKYHLRGRR